MIDDERLWQHFHHEQGNSRSCGVTNQTNRTTGEFVTILLYTTPLLFSLALCWLVLIVRNLPPLNYAGNGSNVRAADSVCSGTAAVRPLAGLVVADSGIASVAAMESLCLSHAPRHVRV